MSQAGISRASSCASLGKTSATNLSHAGHLAVALNTTGNCAGERNAGECGFSSPGGYVQQTIPYVDDIKRGAFPEKR